MAICPKCGRQNQEDALRCDQCGELLGAGELQGDSHVVAAGGAGGQTTPQPEGTPVYQPPSPDSTGAASSTGPASSTGSTGSTGFRLFGAQIDFSGNSPYDHVGGWFLVLTIAFALSALNALYSVFGGGAQALSFLYFITAGVLVVMLYLTFTKNKLYFTLFYVYAGLQLLAELVSIPRSLTVANSLVTTYVGTGVFRVFTLIGAIIGLLLSAAFYVALWYYLRKSERVAVYFG